LKAPIIGKNIRIDEQTPCLLFILFFSIQVSAWNATGHRLTAWIAWEHLTPKARLEASRLLHQHPDFQHWARRTKDRDANRGIFVESSVWADRIRYDKRFYDAGAEAPTPLLPGFPDMRRHRSWHYVNRPVDGSPLPSSNPGRLHQKIPKMLKTIGQHQGLEKERIYALPWIIHLVGDAHQPLHTSILLNAKGQWDAQGTLQKIVNPFNRHKSVSTLHTYWDNLPGFPNLKGGQIGETAKALMAIYPKEPLSLSSDQWINESWAIARIYGCPPKNQGEYVIIDKIYHEQALEITHTQLIKAGYRLAELLNKALAP